MWLKLFILVSAFFCVACGGNPDLGKQALLRAKSSSTSASTNPAAAAAAALAQVTCKAFTVYNQGDSSFSQLFAGSSVCYAKANAAVTTVKVNSFSAGSRYCLIPIQGEIAQTESCFTTSNYTISVNLQISSYTALVLVPEVYIAAYKMYLNGQTTVAPPLAVSIL